MKISLDNFESLISLEIAERGEKYFNKGAVVELEEINVGFWSAIVEGHAPYKVTIMIHNAQITDWVCDCPYDLGPVCKHEVATAFAIRKLLSCGGFSKKKLVKKEKSEKQDISQKVDDTVTLSKGTFRKIVKSSLRSGKNRDGFIDFWSGRRAVAGIDDLFATAEEMLHKKQLENPIHIYQVAIEETVPALQYADDSNGEMGDVIRYSFEKMKECATKIHDEKIRKNFLKYCLQQSTDANYDGWSDWQWDFIRISSLLITEEEMGILFAKMDEIIKKKSERDTFDHHFDDDQSAEIKLQILKRLKGKKEAIEFIDKNLERTPIRKEALEFAFGEKDYARAKKMANDGIVLDTKRKWPGLVYDWMEWLYKIACEENNTNDIIKNATDLFLGANRENFVYYEKLKSLYAVDDWKKQVDELIRSLEKTRFSYYGTYAEIYIREERWEDLLALVEKHLSLDIIDSYRKYLEKYFPDELVVLYEKTIRKTLEQTIGRGVYVECCRMFQRMKKLGAQERVQELLTEFKQTYKNRRAFLEEIEGV